MKKLDTNTPPHPKKGKPLHTGAGKHKQMDSPFLLTNLLHSRQTGHGMRGEAPIKKLVNSMKTYRYYFDGGAAVHAEKGLNIRRIPAEPVERAVLGVVEEVFGNSRSLAQRVEAAISEIVAAEPSEELDQEVLLSEKETLLLRLRRAYKLLGKSGVEAIADDMAADQERLDEINRQLKAAQRPESQPVLDAKAAAKNVIRRLTHVREHLHDLPNAEMKRLLAAIIDGLEIDLATGELTFTLVLPEWMARPASEDLLQPTTRDDANDTVRLDWKLPWPSTAEANEQQMTLSRWKCEKTAKYCYSCSRLRPAA